MAPLSACAPPLPNQGTEQQALRIESEPCGLSRCGERCRNARHDTNIVSEAIDYRLRHPPHLVLVPGKWARMRLAPRCAPCDGLLYSSGFSATHTPGCP